MIDGHGVFNNPENLWNIDDSVALIHSE